MKGRKSKGRSYTKQPQERRREVESKSSFEPTMGESLSLDDLDSTSKTEPYTSRGGRIHVGVPIEKSWTEKVRQNLSDIVLIVTILGVVVAVVTWFVNLSSSVESVENKTKENGDNLKVLSAKVETLNSEYHDLNTKSSLIAKDVDMLKKEVNDIESAQKK